MATKRLLEHVLTRLLDKVIDAVFNVRILMAVGIVGFVAGAETTDLLPEGVAPSEIITALWDLIQQCTEKCFDNQ